MPQESALFPSTRDSMKRWPSAQSLAVFYAQIALGAAFLSGIASRFGVYGRNEGYGNFANFLHYTAQVNSFMPAFTISFLGWLRP